LVGWFFLDAVLISIKYCFLRIQFFTVAVIPSFMLSAGYDLSIYQQQPSAWKIISSSLGGGSSKAGAVTGRQTCPARG